MFRSFRIRLGFRATVKSNRFFNRAHVELDTLEDRTAPAAFTPGDLSVLLAASNSTTNTTASIVEIQSAGAAQTPLQTISAVSVGSDSIRVNGSTTTSLYGALSNDRSLFAFTGHISSGTGVSANTITTRGVFTVDAAGTLAEATTYTGSSGQTAHSATSVNNSTWYIADGSGIYSNGTSSGSPTGSYRGVKAFGGTVYALLASTNSPPVGVLSAPTGGTFAALPGLANGTSNYQDFCLISSGSNGSTYDVLYLLVAPTATAGTISKFSLVNGSWTANGTTYTTSFGGFALTAAKNAGGGANLYVTSGTGATSGNRVILLNDAAGYNAALNIATANNVTLYTAAVATTLKGVDFAPDDGIQAIAGLPASANFVLGSGNPIVLGSSASFGDKSNFEGGSLTISGANPGDTLAIAQDATVTLSGSDVLWSGKKIGVFSGGTNGSNLVISFRDVTSAFTDVVAGDTVEKDAVQALARGITFTTTGSAAARTLVFSIAQINGLTAAATTIVNVKSASTISVTSGDVVYSGSAYSPTVSSIGSTGAVTYSYYDGSNGVGNVLSSAPTAVGSYSTIAHLAADANYFAADSAVKNFSILAAASAATSVALVGENLPTTGGFLVAFRATVSLVAPSMGVADAGDVSFFVDGAAAAAFTTPVDGGGVAVYTTSSLSYPASHTIHAVFVGTTNFGPSTSNPVTAVINDTIRLTPANGALAVATVGSSYSQPIVADNGTGAKAHHVTLGSLPEGLSLDPMTGVISGTPTAAGPTSFDITATDTVGATAVGHYSISVYTPPSLAAGGVVLNGNIPSLSSSADVQHSRVASLAVTFAQPVQLDANAFALALHTNGVAIASEPRPGGYGVLPTSLNVTSADNITWIITFVGNTIDGLDGFHSLEDGVYNLNADSTRVHPLGAASVNAAPIPTTVFYRLFGEVDAPMTIASGTSVTYTANVNTTDNLVLRQSFNAPAAYLADLDADGDHQINTTDNLQFRNRFNRPLVWTV